MLVDAVLQSKGHAVTTARPDMTISEATELLAGPPRIGALVVLDSRQRIIGLLTERDIVRGVGQHGASLEKVTVESLMSRKVPTCEPSDKLGTVMQRMTDRKYRHLPVLRDGALVGLVSLGDVVQAQLRDAQLEVAVLRDAVIARQ